VYLKTASLSSRGSFPNGNGLVTQEVLSRCPVRRRDVSRANMARYWLLELRPRRMVHERSGGRFLVNGLTTSNGISWSLLSLLSVSQMTVRLSCPGLRPDPSL